MPRMPGLHRSHDITLKRGVVDAAPAEFVIFRIGQKTADVQADRVPAHTPEWTAPNAGDPGQTGLDGDSFVFRSAADAVEDVDSGIVTVRIAMPPLRPADSGTVDGPDGFAVIAADQWFADGVDNDGFA